MQILKKDYENLSRFFEIEADPLLSSNFVDEINSSPSTNIWQIFAYFLENEADESEYIG